MAIRLSEIEARVLGVLIEKSMTQLDTYPLTLNAVMLGSNQKTNREPVMNLSEGQVAGALHELQKWQLVSHADTQRGARANRFRHDVEKRFGWNAAQRAVMAELMLRGPQTLGELRGRAARMTPLGDAAYLTELMDELQKSPQPMVIELPRQPGQSSRRWAHLLCGAIDTAAAESPVSSTGSVAVPAAVPPPIDEGDEMLHAEVAALRAELAELRVEVRSLRALIQPPGQ